MRHLTLLRHSVALAAFFLFKNGKSKRKKSTIVLTGIVSSGKTALFYRVCFVRQFLVICLFFPIPFAFDSHNVLCVLIFIILLASRRCFCQQCDVDAWKRRTSWNRRKSICNSLCLHRSCIHFKTPSFVQHIDIVDVPGHGRLRHLRRQFISAAAAIVIVVDAANFRRESRLVAEWVFMNECKV